MIIFDRYGRRISNLRIVITTECNYRCIFCHAEGYYHCAPNGEGGLSPREVELIARVARMFGISHVKITGGEPLLRKDICQIIAVFRDLGFADISLVTNGSLLGSMADRLKMSGLSRINISLPSLRAEVYDYITGTRGNLAKVLDGIAKALEVGLWPVKVNVVVLRGINEEEWHDFIRFAESTGVMLQFIEYHAPLGSEELSEYHVPLRHIEEYLEDHAVRVYVRNMNARRVYVLDTGVEVEVVSPMYNPEFCANCTRIRATPTGWKPCLLREEIVNFSEDIRSLNLRGLVAKFLKAIALRRPYFRPRTPASDTYNS